MKQLASFAQAIFGITTIFCISNLIFRLGYETRSSIAGLVISIPMFIFCHRYLHQITIREFVGCIKQDNRIPNAPLLSRDPTIKRFDNGILSRTTGIGKPKATFEEWAKVVLEQITSEKYDRVRKDMYKLMKEKIPTATVSEQCFIDEMLGADLELISFIAVKTNIKLGIVTTISINEYVKKLPLDIQERVKGSYKHCNKKIAEFGKMGKSGYEAIATACAERLNLENSPDFIQYLKTEFCAFGEILRVDASQYKFISLPEELK